MILEEGFLSIAGVTGRQYVVWYLFLVEVVRNYIPTPIKLGLARASLLNPIILGSSSFKKD